jgi:integrase
MPWRILGEARFVGDSGQPRPRADGNRQATPHVQTIPRPKSSNGWFRRAVKTAGIQAVTPHDLRHTCASLAVSAGVNVLALALMLGHKDRSVTLRGYADLFDTDLDAVASALDLKCAHSVPKARPVGTVGA